MYQYLKLCPSTKELENPKSIMSRDRYMWRRSGRVYRWRGRELNNVEIVPKLPTPPDAGLAGGCPASPIHLALSAWLPHPYAIHLSPISCLPLPLRRQEPIYHLNLLLQRLTSIVMMDVRRWHPSCQRQNGQSQPLLYSVSSYLNGPICTQNSFSSPYDGRFNEEILQERRCWDLVALRHL